MKIIKLFLALTIVLLSSTSELTLPKCIKYESIKKVIENDWTFASKRIKKFIDNNSTMYVNTFMKLLDKPFILKTDEEYIKEQIIRHEEFLKDKNLTAMIHTPIENIDEYSRRVKKEVKYGIYSFERYSNVIGISLYRGMYLYIRYLESIGQYEKSYQVYKKIAQYFLKLHQVSSRDFIHSISYNFMIDEYIKSLRISIQSKYYSIEERKSLYYILAQFLDDKSAYTKMLVKEKETLYKSLDMIFLDKDSSADSIIKNEIFFKGMLKITNEENLKKNLNNKVIRELLVKNTKERIEAIYSRILHLKSKDEYEKYANKMDDIASHLSYIQRGRLFLLYVVDYIDNPILSDMLKYNFSSNEFIKFTNKFYILFAKPWIWGKWKFEFAERYQKNRKFLETLK